MKILIWMIVIVLSFACPVHAVEITAPAAPDSVQELVPNEPATFYEGLMYIQPAVVQGAGTCLSVIAAVLLVSLIQKLPASSTRTVALAGVVVVATLLVAPSNTLIRLGVSTVNELSEYGKLFLPVMTTALAAQGGATSSAAIYTGTVLFSNFLSGIISNLVTPMIYIFLCLSVANSSIGEPVLKRLQKFVKWLITWSLKLVLYFFTGYIGITGVISGSADAAAIKATKLTISGVVPVVGNILSDASETILVSAGVMKNAAGIYGMFVIMALWISPFIQIGVQHLLLKISAAVSEVFGSKQLVELVQDFSTAMGFLLAMTGAVCLLLLISTVCFMKGVG